MYTYNLCPCDWTQFSLDLEVSLFWNRHQPLLQYKIICWINTIICSSEKHLTSYIRHIFIAYIINIISRQKRIHQNTDIQFAN